MPITAHVPVSHLEGTVTDSDDPRVPVGARVGLRLADFESGASGEPTAEFSGRLYPVLSWRLEHLPDGSTEVQFDLQADK